MKLRNKRTGEIVDGGFVLTYYDGIAGNPQHSLAELNEEWEDMPEEPKEHWCINEFGTPEMAGRFNRESIYDKSRKLIGNYFETKEEVEKAIEKLKAFKRLKDKGLKAFSSEICGDDFVVNFKLTNHTGYSQSIDDFDCIFDLGGEE